MARKLASQPAQAEANPLIETRPLVNISSFSGATEESLAAYAERTLQTLGAADANLDVSFLYIPSNAGQEISNVPITETTSESDKIEREPGKC